MPRVEWKFNGKLLTIFNICAMLITIGLYLGTIKAHVDDRSIHQETEDKLKQIQIITDPIEKRIKENRDKADERYERILQELTELKVLIKKEQ